MVGSMNERLKGLVVNHCMKRLCIFIVVGLICFRVLAPYLSIFIFYSSHDHLYTEYLLYNWVELGSEYAAKYVISAINEQFIDPTNMDFT